MPPKFKNPRKGQETSGGFRKVATELNLWPEDTSNPREGDTLTGLVLSKKLDGQFGLQVKVLEPDGTIRTLAAHKVLSSMLENVPGGLVPGVTVLRVTVGGRKMSKKYKKEMTMYELEYRARTSEDVFEGLDGLTGPGEDVPF